MTIKIPITQKIEAAITLSLQLEPYELRFHICEYFGLEDWNVVTSGVKTRELTTARWAYVYFSDKYLRRSANSIAIDLDVHVNNVYSITRRVEELLSINDQIMVECISKITIQIFKAHLK